MGRNDEAHIQKFICQWLKLHNYFFHSIPNELAGADAAIRMSRFKTLGLRSGAPDLIVYLNNAIVCLEVKTATGSQSESQINFESRIKQLGHEYYVVRGLEDVEKIFNDGERK
jgi:hypothetical protein